MTSSINVHTEWRGQNVPPTFRSIGAGGCCFRLGFGAIELAHDVSADGPRRDLGRRGLLALAVRALVGATDEFAFDEDVRSPLDRRRDIFGQPRAENISYVESV